MGDRAVYVYAVGDAVLAGSDEIPAIRGVDDAATRVIVDGALAAVVGSVDAARFTEESLRRGLGDLRWLEDTARAHNGVVAALARAHPVAPVRMATVYVDDDNVRALLRQHAVGFTAALDRIRGRSEWGVKAYAGSSGPMPPRPPDTGAGPGTAYLMRRRTERAHAARTREDVLATANAVHRRIAELAAATRRYPPQDPRLSGHTDEMVLNAAYLVDDGGAAALHQAIAVEHDTGLRLELTGPWAPYSFATLEPP